MSVTHTWRGHESTILLEFGSLTPRTRCDGSPGQPEGTFALIGWSWRIDDDSAIICGSWSDDAALEAGLLSLRGTTVTTIDTFGKLPELAIGLSNRYHVLSFMTSAGDPQWTLFDRRSAGTKWVHVREGRLVEES